MKKQEAIEKLMEFCKLRTFCELYPDACQKDKCEIYMAIKALEGNCVAQERKYTFGNDEFSFIRRSETIEVLENTDWYHQNANKDMVSGANSNEHQAWYKAEDVYKALESVPSAQLQRKSVNYYGDGYANGQMVYDSAECPCCGYIFDENDNIWGEPYCPHCGQALDWYMRGEQDERKNIL